MLGIPNPSLPDSFRPFPSPHLVPQVVIREVKVNPALLHRPHRLSAEKTRIPGHLLRLRSTLSFYFLHQRHQRPVVGRVLGDPRGHNQVIVADRQIRRVAQLPPLRGAQKTTVRIGQRNPAASPSWAAPSPPARPVPVVARGGVARPRLLPDLADSLSAETPAPAADRGHTVGVVPAPSPPPSAARRWPPPASNQSPRVPVSPTRPGAPSAPPA